MAENYWMKAVSESAPRRALRGKNRGHSEFPDLLSGIGRINQRLIFSIQRGKAGNSERPRYFFSFSLVRGFIEHSSAVQDFYGFSQARADVLHNDEQIEVRILARRSRQSANVIH